MISQLAPVRKGSIRGLLHSHQWPSYNTADIQIHRWRHCHPNSSKMQTAIKPIASWSTDNYLSVNTPKTKEMLISPAKLYLVVTSARMIGCCCWTNNHSRCVERQSQTIFVGEARKRNLRQSQQAASLFEKSQTVIYDNKRPCVIQQNRCPIIKWICLTRLAILPSKWWLLSTWKHQKMHHSNHIWVKRLWILSLDVGTIDLIKNASW